MGFSKKTAKGRLDKYYFLAKDQGFRARSAFKLVQLNKKYGLLDRARVAVDLCAAPGGWLQVAAQTMPPGRVIVGVDLVPIRPIDDVSTIVADITSERCRTELQRVLRGWKADVVLHDGAPNVGRAWVHDAHAQAELVLHALRLATELLVPGGSFVSKVFRSADYNAVVWVLGQLFERVEATKPASSRDVSAEIFVVARGFRAPERIDPRLLDPRSVFAEVSPKGDGEATKVNLLHPEKRTRSRGGYADGATLLYSEARVDEFISSRDHATLLATHSRLVFPPDTDARISAAADASPEDVRALCADLKVLGFREFRVLAKWRLRVRQALGLDAPKESAASDIVSAEPIALPDDPLDELDALARRARRTERRERTRALERKARQRLRMRADAGHAGDLAADSAVTDGLFSLTSASAALSDADEDAMDNGAHAADDSDDSDYIEALERQFEHMHALRTSRDRLRADPEEHVRATRSLPEAPLAVDDAVSGDSASSDSDDSRIPSKKGKKAHIAANDCDADDVPQPGALAASLLSRAERTSEADARIDMWYANPLFRELDMDTGAGVRRVADMGDAALESSKKKLERLRKKTEPRRAKKAKDAGSASDSEIELVPARRDDKPESSESDDEHNAPSAKSSDDEVDASVREAVLTPEGMSLAAALTRDRKRTLRDLQDDSFNRHAVGDDEAAALPRWFLDDEATHNRPHVPVTKEGIALLREKQRELDARPIKKVLEARGRNRRRAEKHADALKQRAAAIADAEDLGERQKALQIQRLLAKSAKPQRKEKKYVVARGNNRGIKGRPRGVRGHYKMVDSRLKKDLRNKAARAGKAGKAGKKGRR